MGYVVEPLDAVSGKVDTFLLVLTSTERRPLTELIKFKLDKSGNWQTKEKDRDRVSVWGRMQ